MHASKENPRRSHPRNVLGSPSLGADAMRTSQSRRSRLCETFQTLREASSSLVLRIVPHQKLHGRFSRICRGLTANCMRRPAVPKRIFQSEMWKETGDDAVCLGETSDFLLRRRLREESLQSQDQ